MSFLFITTHVLLAAVLLLAVLMAVPVFRKSEVFLESLLMVAMSLYLTFTALGLWTDAARPPEPLNSRITWFLGAAFLATLLWVVTIARIYHFHFSRHKEPHGKAEDKLECGWLDG